MDELLRIDHYKNATIVIYSDHGHITHLRQNDLSVRDRLLMSTDPILVLWAAGALSEAEKEGKGFAAIGVCSYSMLHWKADTLAEREDRARQAKEILLRHKIRNPATGNVECPWYVLDHKDMRDGLLDEDGRWLIKPGELWHSHFGTKNDNESLLWPDLFLFMRNGWQAAAYNGQIANLGITIPFPVPPTTLFIGGHGSLDTQSILMAILGPEVERGVVLGDDDGTKDYRIGDLAVTVAKMYGLELRTETVGQDRRAEVALREASMMRGG